MTERPILFSAPMIRAILDGRKTQTRRVLKQPPDADLIYKPRGSDQWLWTDDDGGSGTVNLPFAPGDTLWVREAWFPEVAGEPGFPVWYRATDEATIPYANVRWKPSIFMPRWASRITLKVTAVKVERLQDISEADAEAEGVDKPVLPHWPGLPFKSAFRGIWHDINGAASWEANPWVAAISFERIKP